MPKVFVRKKILVSLYYDSLQNILKLMVWRRDSEPCLLLAVLASNVGEDLDTDLNSGKNIPQGNISLAHVGPPIKGNVSTTSGIPTSFAICKDIVKGYVYII
jgi:hypothetical protein